MAQFDYPNISIDNKSNEQNMQATKAHLNALADQLNYYIDSITNTLNEHESRISKLEKGE